ncbi:hypothetical protein EJ110_NYTH58148 [Nymphaea thermarum]|nr:hypothetical protein EJ110_NYTH58148 [Nymphaea thermarum]
MYGRPLPARRLFGSSLPSAGDSEHKLSKAIKGAPLESLFAQFCLHSLWFGMCNIRAKDMWNSLRQTYSQDKNISKILQVQQELLQMQQGDMDLTEYFTKLKFTYEKMNSLKPPCKHCLKSHMEQMIVVKFLAGLSSDYSASKAQMLTGSDFPYLDEAFNRLNRLIVTLPPSSNNSQPSALASFGGGRSGLYSSRGRGRGRGSGGRGRLQCTYCGRLGHLKHRCWNKVGKPNSSTSSIVTSSSGSTPNTQSSIAPVTPHKFSPVLKIVRNLQGFIKGVIDEKIVLVPSLFRVGAETARGRVGIRQTRGPSPGVGRVVTVIVRNLQGFIKGVIDEKIVLVPSLFRVGAETARGRVGIRQTRGPSPGVGRVVTAPKPNPTAASVDATSLNLSPAEIDLVMEHRSNATSSTSSASTAVTSSAYSAELTAIRCFIIFCSDASSSNSVEI